VLLTPSGLPLGRVGLGCQLLSDASGPCLSQEENIKFLREAHEAGIRLFDTAGVYAPGPADFGHNESLLGAFLNSGLVDRDDVFIATKVGNLFGEKHGFVRNGRPEHLRQACEDSLRRLRVDVIDLLQLHGPDPNVPLIESFETLKTLQQEGKARLIGLSNVGRRDLQSVPEEAVASVQNQFSPIAQAALSVLTWCGERNIPFLCWSPLGRAQAATLGQTCPSLEGLARDHGVTVQRMALAWELALGSNVLPIPGATTIAQVRDNLAAADMSLSAEDLAVVLVS